MGRYESEKFPSKKRKRKMPVSKKKAELRKRRLSGITDTSVEPKHCQYQPEPVNLDLVKVEVQEDCAELPNIPGMERVFEEVFVKEEPVAGEKLDVQTSQEPGVFNIHEDVKFSVQETKPDVIQLDKKIHEEPVIGGVFEPKQEPAVFNIYEDIEFSAEETKPDIVQLDKALEKPKNDDAPFEDNTSPDNENEPFNAAHDESESTILRNGSKDNDRDSGNSTVHKGGPPVGRKRKPENVVVIGKQIDEAYGFLKQVATKEKMKKSETQLFCDLLCTRLEVLDAHKRDIVMHKINKLMFHAKNSNCLPNAMPNQHFYQQPPNFTNVNQYQPSAFGSSENSQSLLSPAPTPTPSTSSQGNGDAIPKHSDTEHGSIVELFSNFNSNQQ